MTPAPSKRRKPGEKCDTNDFIIAMRKNGRSIEAIAQEMGESKWYVHAVIHLQMRLADRDAAAKLCKEIASTKGIETKRRRDLWREKFGDVEVVEDEEDKNKGLVRIPLPKDLGVLVNRDLLIQLRDHVRFVGGVSLSEVIFPLIDEHLRLLTDAIEQSIEDVLDLGGVD